MPQVMFYQLSAGAHSAAQRACELVADAYARKQKVTVMCESQTLAEDVDELLWQLPAARFVPHNLHGEGPPAGTPVEICWQVSQLSRRPLIVNLGDTMLPNPQQYQRIIDFVPADDAEKQAARVRYKKYQQAGCNMQFTAAEN
ncbi:DNA polymerase III subunit chi [Alteromonas sp. ASW11-19]|uniref:DNA polymerase III subunit chi n=1 Tax=Alteromonas salexigens TaxID=2982530 RepID=A0ABT2VQ19_9ALTE|nr:DNA polymerase III subunit chi [Alteromonas salexigens]MCU7555412.1 DNA polymerase III subunit chi [Alteromonas salexigens]